MLFCLAAKNNSLVGYYDQANNPATPELVASMPPNAKLIFWDYYHTSPDIYSQKIQQHREMGCPDPWIASKVLSKKKLFCQYKYVVKTDAYFFFRMFSLCMDLESILVRIAFFI